MSVFLDPTDEERLCSVLKAYVEEWVLVSVPREWHRYGTDSLGRVRLEFATESSICISVHYEFVKIDYSVQLHSH